jgi:hypothetical protein
MKKTIKQLELERVKIQQQINKIENDEFIKKQVPFLKSLVGKCFVYRDNSCGGDTPKWDVYKKILDLVETKDGSFVFICKEFETNGDGNAKLEITNHFVYSHKNWWNKIPFPGFIACSEEEFEIEYLKTLNEMSTQKIMRKRLNLK